MRAFPKTEALSDYLELCVVDKQTDFPCKCLFHVMTVHMDPLFFGDFPQAF